MNYLLIIQEKLHVPMQQKGVFGLFIKGMLITCRRYDTRRKEKSA